MTAPSAAPLPTELVDAASRVTAEDCLITLARILDNILKENSYTAKTRRLKTTNGGFQKRILDHGEGGMAFLRICGFEDREDGVLLELRREKESKLWLWQARCVLQQRAQALQDQVTTSLPPVPAKPNDDRSDIARASPSQMDAPAKDIDGKASEKPSDGISSESNVNSGHILRSSPSSPVNESLDDEIQQALMDLPDIPKQKRKSLSAASSARSMTESESSSESEEKENNTDPSLDQPNMPSDATTPISNPSESRISSDAVVALKRSSFYSSSNVVDEKSSKIFSNTNFASAEQVESNSSLVRSNATILADSRVSLKGRPAYARDFSLQSLAEPRKGQDSVDLLRTGSSIHSSKHPGSSLAARVMKVFEGPELETPLRDSSQKLVDNDKSWDDLRLHMKKASLTQEFEVCWAALCLLSETCSDLRMDCLDLPTGHAGLDESSSSSSVSLVDQAWLPYEVVEMLWAYALSTDNTVEPSRVCETCLQLYNALVDVNAIEVYKRQDDEDMPHSTWIRIQQENETWVQNGLSFEKGKEHGPQWIATLAQALADDMQLWFGRVALPTIAVAGMDGLSKTRILLKDPELIQSRLDILGVVTGTQQHIADCRMYVTLIQKAARQKREARSKSQHLKPLEPLCSIGIGTVLEACQQLAASLYRVGQLMVKSKDVVGQKLEIASALYHLGMAVGEWKDFGFETQLYAKSLKLHREIGDYESEPVADTMFSMGTSNISQGNFGAAMSCVEEAYDVYVKSHGNEHAKVAKCLHSMGVIHCERSDLDMAMDCFKASMKIRQANLDGDEYDMDSSNTLCWIGKVYREQGLVQKALKYFEAALVAKKRLHGGKSLEVAEILHNIAVILDDQGDWQTSLTLYNESLRTHREVIGDENEEVCDLLACIGNIHRSMGDISMAVAVFRMALELRVAIADSATPERQHTRVLIDAYVDLLDALEVEMRHQETSNTDDVGDLLLKLGHLYDEADEYENAIKAFEKSLEVWHSLDDRAKSAKVLNAIGVAHGKRQNYEDATEAFKEAVSLRKKVTGEAAIDLAETYHNLGNCAAKSSNLGDARVYYDEALRIKRKLSGDRSASIAQTLHNLGHISTEQNDTLSAMRLYREALAIRKSCLGDDHLEVAYSLHCIGKVHHQRNELEEARKSFIAALQIKRIRLRKGHRSVGETLQQLGSLYSDIGDSDEAVLCLNGALTIYRSNKECASSVADVYEALGHIYLNDQDHSKSLKCFNKAIKARKSSSEIDLVALAEVYYQVGKLQRLQGQDHDALLSFQAATRIRKKKMGRNDLVIADILRDAGELQMQLKQIEVANKCFLESLRIRQTLLPKKHPMIGDILLNCGDVEHRKGDVSAAIPLLLEALDIFTNDHEDHSAQEAEVCHRLGLCYKIQDDSDRAIDYLDRCLSLQRELNEDNLSAGDASHELGIIYLEQGNHAKAEELLRDAVEVRTKMLGDDHLAVAETVVALGRACIEMNSPDEAVMYFEQARLIRQQHLDDSHLDCLEITRYIGDAQGAKGEHEEALKCWHSYLKARRASVGDDEVCGDVMHSIGSTEHHLRNYDVALKNLTSALALYREHLAGDGNLSVANTLFSLGLTCDARGEYKQAMKHHKEAFRLRRQLLGEDHLEVAASLDNIATLYMKQPNPTRALESLKEALRIRTLLLDKRDLAIGTTLFGMGVVFAELDQLEKAMDCYEVSLTIRKERLGEASEEVAQTLHNIGTVLAKQREYEKALDHWRQALVAYRESGLSDEQHAVAITIGNIQMAENHVEDMKRQKELLRSTAEYVAK